MALNLWRMKFLAKLKNSSHICTAWFPWEPKEVLHNALRTSIFILTLHITNKGKLEGRVGWRGGSVQILASHFKTKKYGFTGEEVRQHLPESRKHTVYANRLDSGMWWGKRVSINQTHSACLHLYVTGGLDPPRCVFSLESAGPGLRDLILEAVRSVGKWLLPWVYPLAHLMPLGLSSQQP